MPGSNPFVAGGPVAARPEIWAFGLRNPWRYSFDDPARGGTGALVIGDVGQNAFEEIDYEPPNRGGRNYGWRNREGAHDNVTSRPPAFLPLVDPIHEYGRNAGQSITGGYVYRGRALGAAYVGRYFFADYVQGRVWSIALALDSQGEARASGLMEHTTELGGQSQLGNISSFGVDARRRAVSGQPDSRHRAQGRRPRTTHADRPARHSMNPAPHRQSLHAESAEHAETEQILALDAPRRSAVRSSWTAESM